MHIIQIANDVDKKRITRNILEELPEWFGIPEAREEYIRDSAGRTSFVLKKMKKPWDFCISSRRGKIRLSLRLWAS